MYSRAADFCDQLISQSFLKVVTKINKNNINRKN